MPIKTVHTRLREGGKIRMGEKKTTAKGVNYPVALTHFRITSSNKETLAVLASVYGGTVRPWAGAQTEGQFELYTESSALDVTLPPTEFGFSQFMELWSGGTCSRRCDGEWDFLADKPCFCDPSAPECKPMTRLSVLFPILDDWTLFRVDTGSWNAASEMGATIGLIHLAKAAGKMLPARLLLEQRQKKVQVPDGTDRTGKFVLAHVETRKFVVPSLEIAVSKLALAGAESDLPMLVDHSTGEILQGESKELNRAVGEPVGMPALESAEPDDDDLPPEFDPTPKPWAQRLHIMAQEVARPLDLDGEALLDGVISYATEGRTTSANELDSVAQANRVAKLLNGIRLGTVEPYVDASGKVAIL